MKRLLMLTTLLFTLLSGLAEPHMVRAQGTGPFAYIANNGSHNVSAVDTSSIATVTAAVPAEINSLSNI